MEKEKRIVETVSEGCGTRSRETAEGVLASKSERSSRRGEAIRILIKVIPWSFLTRKDEELLWELFCEW